MNNQGPSLVPLVRVFVTALAAACIAPHPATAQSIEEIVVVARKRQENLQDVPLSIAAFSIEEMQDRNIKGIYGIAEATPNFTMGRTLGRRLDAPTVRGQFTPQIGSSESNAAFYIDDVFITASASRVPIAALERVEVLRGPQSAIFGRSAFAGAINFITRRPTNEFEGELNARTGSDDDYSLSSWFSGPIIRDKLFYMVSGNWDNFEGEWNNSLGKGAADPANAVPNPDPNRYIYPTRADSSALGGEETWDLTGKLSWRPTENFEFNGKLSYTETEDDHFTAFLVEHEELNCFRNQDSDRDRVWEPVDPVLDAGVRSTGRSPGWFCGELRTSGRSQRISIPDFQDGVTDFALGTDLLQYMGIPPGTPVVGINTAAPIETGPSSEAWRFLAETIIDFGFLQLGDLDLSGWGFIARYSHNEDDNHFLRDLDRTEGRGIGNSGNFHVLEFDELEDDQIELRLISPDDKRIRGLIGYYYYDQTSQQTDRRFTGGRVDRLLFDDDPTPTTLKHRAAFGMIELDFLSAFTLSLEGRYGKDEREVNPQNGIESFDDSTYRWTPRYTLTYQSKQDRLFYGLVAKGAKPGGFNGNFFSADVPQEVTTEAFADGRAIIDEEEAWTYEVGAKTTWLDGRAVFNIALFYIDWTNQQVQTTLDRCALVDVPVPIDPLDPDPCTVRNPLWISNPATGIISAGESKVVGGEIEVSYRVNDNLTLSAGYGLADTELEELNDNNVRLLTGFDDSDLLQGGNVSGNEAPRSPKHSFNFTGVYNRRLTADWNWFLRSDYTYESKRWATPANLAHSGDRHLWNVRLGIEDNAWSISAYVDNILDDDSPELISRFINVNERGNPTLFTMVPQRGTNYGATVQYRF